MTYALTNDCASHFGAPRMLGEQVLLLTTAIALSCDKSGLQCTIF
jgi:hypothetical protein